MFANKTLVRTAGVTADAEVCDNLSPAHLDPTQFGAESWYPSLTSDKYLMKVEA